MAENVIALGYLLFLAGIVLAVAGKTRPGVKLAIAGVLLVVKTMAVLAAVAWMRQHWQSSDSSAQVVWMLIAIPVALIAGVLAGIYLVVSAMFRTVRRTLAAPEARAALGGALIGTIAAEVIRGRGRGERRLP